MEGLREWNPNRPVSRAPAGVGRCSRLGFAQSFEKQPVRTVAQGLATQSGITLLHLPSYSPNHQDVICPLRRYSMRCYGKIIGVSSFSSKTN